MKNLILSLLSVSTLMLWSGAANAACKIAVGGPGMHPDSRFELTSSLTEMFTGESDFNIEVFEATSLPMAVSLEADYMVYLKGSSSHVQVQFRDLLLNKILWETQYSAAMGLASTVAAISRDIQQEALPLLASYCRAAR